MIRRIWRGLSTCWTLPDADAADRSRLLNQQLRTLFLIVPIFGVTNTLSVAGMLMLLWSGLPLSETIKWCVVYFFFQIGWAGHALLRSTLRRRPRRIDHTQRDLWISAFWCAGTAACWGVAVHLWAHHAYSQEQRILLLSFVPGLIAAGVLVSITAPLVAAVWLGVLLPILCFAALRLDYIDQGLTVAFVVLYGVMLTSAFLLISRLFVSRVAAELSAELLAVDLRRQKEIAEEARKIAEEANRAKSSFLAAASHDLRQPVHALSLFVGALREVSKSPDAERLIDQIDASTNAMDKLFTALLDISRLDAGIVPVDRHPFLIGPILDRVCRDHAGEAASKGLTLSCVPGSATVDSDPILVERIMRNFVSNAVRYTDAGRIVVGCRRRSAFIALQVWDTGRGISPEQQDRVFQEYYQIGNPERDREKGLGLGLAIVRRLADLLECELSLSSEPGRGSCFEISIARSSCAASPPKASVDEHYSLPSTGFVVVVDDEQAIREGMSSLLTRWGYEVAVAGSSDEAVRVLSTVMTRPDLLICDLRLRDDENGIEAIEKLRAEYNENIPAILITGDTASSRLLDAHASGLVLLHKPVPNGKLRAAIAHLVAVSTHRQRASDPQRYRA